MDQFTYWLHRETEVIATAGSLLALITVHQINRSRPTVHLFVKLQKNIKIAQHNMQCQNTDIAVSPGTHRLPCYSAICHLCQVESFNSQLIWTCIKRILNLHFVCWSRSDLLNFECHCLKCVHVYIFSWISRISTFLYSLSLSHCTTLYLFVLLCTH